MPVFRSQLPVLIGFIALMMPGIFANPVLAAADCAAVSGLWFDPAFDGEGFNLTETRSGLVITFYGYDKSGQRLWLISANPVVFGTDVTVTMLEGQGGTFQVPLPPEKLSEWGSLSMRFFDHRSGVFRLSGRDGDKVSEVVKLAGVVGQNCNPVQCTIATEGSSRVKFANDGKQGIFDPSLDAEVGSSAVWMSYSTVSTSLRWPAENVSVVHNRLARKRDGEAGFNFVNEVNPAQDVTVSLPSAGSTGTWVNETSSLTYDAWAQPDQRWKLIWHHYLQIAGERYFQHGWLGYRAAARPEGLKDATEIKLFGAGLYDPVNNISGGASQPPVGGAPLIDIRNLSPELSECAVLSEPGWLSNKDALYLSVGCFQINPRENRIALLACDHPCIVTDLAAWRYVSTLLLNAHALALGFIRFSAPDLFTANGETYLWVTPGSDRPFPDSYNGCRAYRFKNLAGGELQTDADGQPIAALTLDGLPDSFNGACALHAAVGEQAFYSQLKVAEADGFQIFRASTKACFSSLSP